MHRRRFLAAAGAVTALAGCLGDDGGFAAGGFGGDGDDDRTLELSLSAAPTPLRSAYVVDLASTERPGDERAFAATRSGETVTTAFRRPFGARPDDPVYTRRDGTYYRLGAVVVDEATATRPVLRLSAVSDDGDGDGDGDGAPSAVGADSLSTLDRRIVHVAYMAARARGNVGGAPWGLVERGGYAYRDEATVERSRLVGDDAPSHVAYRDAVYAVETTRERFHGPVYRATVDPVAETPERMEAILRAQFVDARLSGDDLSAAREVLREARGEGHGETHPYSAGYRSVLTALHARAYLDGDVQKDAYVEDPGKGTVRYDGTYYDYRLRFLDGD